MSRVSTEAERHEARRRWFTTTAAGDYLGVSPDHVLALIDAGDLRGMDASRSDAKRRDMRIKPEWCDEFIERRSRGPQSAA